MFLILELTVFLLLGVLSYYYFLSSKRIFPPGPWNIPFYSGMFAIGDEPHKTFQKWSKRYGPLVRVKLGAKETLIIDDPKMLREAFNDSAFLGRPYIPLFHEISGGKRGINFTEGEEWAGFNTLKTTGSVSKYSKIFVDQNSYEQRRFALRTLRDFGFGKHSMEEFIMEEVQEFLAWMKKNEGVPVRMDRRFRLATVSSLWKLLVGERQEHDDEVVDDIIDDANIASISLGQIHHPYAMYPKLIDILPKIFLKDWYSILDATTSFHKLFSNAVEKHLQNPAEENSPRDLTDVYLAKIKRTTDPKSCFYKERGHQNLKAVLANLYKAGEGTTSSTLTWTLLYLVRFPEVQQKLHRELDAVIGPGRTPSLSDRLNLLYTDALTQEIFRYSSHVPLSLPHETMEDTSLGGYNIKKGTMVLPNLYSIHYNKDIWGDPENFRPERFLSTDGKTILKSKDLLPFGTGKRQCAGETFARDNYFLFLTSIFQRFEVLPDPENPTPSLKAMHGFLREARKFKVVIKER